MSKYLIIIILFVLILYYPIYGNIIDDIIAPFDTINTIEIVFSKTLKMDNSNEQVMFKYYNDKEKNIQKIKMKNKKMSLEVFLINDSVFFISDNSKEYYVLETKDNPLANILMQSNIFSPIELLKDLDSNDYIIWQDKNYSYIKVEKDTLLLIKYFLYRVNKDNRVDLIEAHDINGNVIMKTYFKMYENGLPNNIHTQILQDKIINEQILIKDIKINQSIADTVLFFNRKGKKIKSLDELMKQFF